MRNLNYLILVFIAISACENETSEEISTEPSPVTLIDNPVEGNSSLPRLFNDGEELYMSWVEYQDSLSVLRYSKFEKGNWHVSSIVAAGSDWFVNWADFPVISANGDRLINTYLQKSDSATYAYDIKVRYLMPTEREHIAYGPTDIFEEKFFKLHSDTTKTEHGFVSMVPYGEKSFFVSWLDGRNTAGSHAGHDAHGPGAMTLRGAVIDSVGKVIQEVELDSRVCDCCQTSTTITQNGPLVAYRDRSDEEIRDISVVRRVDGEWLKPQFVGNDNWKIAGCPVNGPSVDAFENSVGLAWFTAVKEEGEVQVVFSDDNGANFGKPIRVDSGFATGRVDIVMLNASEAAVLWMEPQGEDEVIRVIKVSSEGKKGQLITVSRTSQERASGFPQVERFGNKLMFAWTDVSGETSSIKTAVLSLDKL